jgi:hypothetical protein
VHYANATGQNCHVNTLYTFVQHSFTENDLRSAHRAYANGCSAIQGSAVFELILSLERENL